MEKVCSTRLAGIIGYPLDHTLSPVMHNAAFKHLGLDWHYVPFSVNPGDLSGALQGLKALNIAGCNVTIPYKEQVIAFLDEVDREARDLGAVNTIVNRNGKLWGYNTDGTGFLRSLVDELNFSVTGGKVLVLGAGGAARAVIYSLIKEGAGCIMLANRNPDRARQLARSMEEKFPRCEIYNYSLAGEHLRYCLESAELLVNTLPLGMYPAVDEMPPLEPEWLAPSLKVCDLIYNPPKTRLLMMAEERGCAVLNGVGMLVNQGAASFQLWTGYQAPVLQMRKAVEEQLMRQK